jgi:hypothetical protein
MFMEMPVDMATLKASFTKKRMKESGFDVESTKDTALAGRTAFQLSGRMNAPDGTVINKVIYLVAYPKRSLMLISNYPAVSPEIRGGLTQIMATARFDKPDSSSNLMSEMGFWIDTTGTGFRYHKSEQIGKSILLMPEGEVAGKEKSSFYVMELPASPATEQLRTDFFQKRVSAMAQDANGKAGPTKEVTIDGVSGFQSEIRGKSKNSQMVMLLTILFSDKRMYMLLGKAITNPESSMTKFKDLAGRFERR